MGKGENPKRHCYLQVFWECRHGADLWSSASVVEGNGVFFHWTKRFGDWLFPCVDGLRMTLGLLSRRVMASTKTLGVVLISQTLRRNFSLECECWGTGSAWSTCRPFLSLSSPWVVQSGVCRVAPSLSSAPHCSFCASHVQCLCPEWIFVIGLLGTLMPLKLYFMAWVFERLDNLFQLFLQVLGNFIFC